MTNHAPTSIPGPDMGDWARRVTDAALETVQDISDARDRAILAEHPPDIPGLIAEHLDVLREHLDEIMPDVIAGIPEPEHDGEKWHIESGLTVECDGCAAEIIVFTHCVGCGNRQCENCEVEPCCDDEDEQEAEDDDANAGDAAGRCPPPPATA